MRTILISTLVATTLHGVADAQYDAPTNELLGVGAASGFGWRTARARDLNGDGVPDILVSARRFGNNMPDVHFVSGSTFTIFGSIVTPIGGLPGFGDAIDGLGDIDGDSFGDVVIGANDRAIIYSGSSGAPLFTFVDASPGDRRGSSVAGIGDVNGDSVPDFLVGSAADDDNGLDAGSATIYSGSDGAVLYRVDGDNAGDELGSRATALGDVTGDSVPDFALSAPLANGPGGVATGLVRIFSGVDGSVVHTVYGPQAGDRLGGSLDRAGDVDGDGTEDVVAGLPGRDVGAGTVGAVIVVSGADGSVLHTIVGDEIDAEFGADVAGIGDADGDGLSEFAASAPNATFGGFSGGAVYVFRGSTGELYSELVDDPGDVDDFGLSICGPGDLDGNGAGDIVVGQPETDFSPPGGLPGDLYLYDMKGPRRIVLQDFSDPREGVDGEGIGDIDGDGRDDFLIGFGIPGELIPLVEVRSGADGSILRSWFHEEVWDIAAAGDCNADGIPDVVVGLVEDPWVARDSYVRIYSGADGSTLVDVPVDAAEVRVAAGGDTNADGYDDVIMRSQDPVLGTQFSAVSVLSGRDGAVLHSLSGLPLSSSVGGVSIDGAGDFNADGWDDFMWGWPGTAEVRSGRDGSVLLSTGGLDYGRRVRGIGDADGDGFADVIVWGATTRVFSGATQAILHDLPRIWERHVGALGDLDGDGSADFLAGVDDDDAVNVISGATGDVLSSWSTWQGSAFTTLRASEPALDANGDGFPDVLAFERDRVYVTDLGYRGSPPRVRTRGAGCAGGNDRTPRIGTRIAPLVGQTMSITLRGGAPNSPGAWIFLGTPTDLPLAVLGLPCSLLVNPFTPVTTGTDAFGMASLDLTFANAGLAGFELEAQWVVPDPSAPYTLSVTLSNAVNIVIAAP